jgi:hypothetical protein
MSANIREISDTLSTSVLGNAAQVHFDKKILINPFTDEAQTALFKDPVRTAL